jgi:hypothetical protein
MSWDAPESDRNGRLPFDRVLIMESGVARELTIGAFFRLPLAERIQLIVEQKATFTLAGIQIDAKEALREMRRFRARAA